MGEERPRARCRVVIIDNDPVTLRGTRSILEEVDEIDLVAAVDHDTALNWTTEWDVVDVAVVDASDARREVDQFPGVAVVEAMRKQRGPDVLVAIVLTGQALHRGLRWRMREAGADFFYSRHEGMTEEELTNAVLHPEGNRRIEAIACDLPPELGVRDKTKVNEVIRRLWSPETQAALDPKGRKKQDPHGSRSRWWDQLRLRAGGPTGLTPVKANGDIALDQDAPSVPQLRKFWPAVTRVPPHDSE